ncbi:hypothetical protein D3H55_22315 [Bacillus salacetis]|uniref:Lipoprotein n=1 Tax=Bacillus salacetis TaxID=2315464 RepID=A0A3A1QPA2_9BACI|nr:hypothetical protein [Bacillus salacetis]RIW28061.1 hypothetical protein D3H55_22315 [Bacillus salacetis]
MDFNTTRKTLLFSFLAAVLMTGCSAEETATNPQTETGQDDTNGSQQEGGGISEEPSGQDENQANDEGTRAEDLTGEDDNGTGQTNEEEENRKDEQTTEEEQNTQEQDQEEETNEHNGTESGRTLTKEQAAEVLQEYEKTFMVETNSEGTVENHPSKEELLSHYRTIMSEELAQGYLEDFFKTENGNLKMVATEPPVWLNPENEYKVNEQSDGTYHVIQSKSSQLRGNREYTFELEYMSGHWQVADVSSVKSGRLTKSGAEQIVRQHLGDDIDKNMIVEYDHMEQDQFGIHVYEQAGKEEESHTATYGWYKVDPETEEVTSLFGNEQEDSAHLKEKANEVLNNILKEDMNALADYVHSEKGLLISPFVNISEKDKVFEKQEVSSLLENEKAYLWGYQDGSGKPMKSTPPEYFQRYQDFSQVDKVIVDDIKQRGNVKMNIKDYFPDSHIVEFYKNGTEENSNIDWSSLYIVFQKNNAGEWKAVALVSGQWTV